MCVCAVAQAMAAKRAEKERKLQLLWKQQHGLEDDSDSDDGGDLTALFDVRLSINCWEEFDLQPLCQGRRPAAGSGAGDSSSLHHHHHHAGGAGGAAGEASWTSKAVMNILESWTADPRRVATVHEWISKVLNAPAMRMVRKSAARFVKAAFGRKLKNGGGKAAGGKATSKGKAKKGKGKDAGPVGE